jgi:hypothetical protein
LTGPRRSFGTGGPAPELPDRRRSNPAPGGSVEAIIAEVLRRLAVTDEAGREIVREAYEDAAAERRPRW